jgi:glycosyltransferase involved in cell wall biosynthesis
VRIAQIAPIIERVPPKKYGGTERMVHALTEELTKKGHKVTLFASGDSQTSAKLVSVYPRSLREAGIKDTYGPNYLTMLNIGLAYNQQDKFDIIHDHNGHLSLPTADISKTPVVMTFHGTFNPLSRQFYKRLGKKVNFVAISNAQRKSARELKWAGTVYNGLNMTKYPFSSKNDGYLLFVGRISHEKGVHHAIEVAQSLDLPLIIAAKLDPVDLPYFNEYIGPRLSSEIKWIGEVEEQERNKLMSRALCFLHPVTWNEPFGLTLIESMACGCPVVAFARGSIPEIILNRKTGYVVNDEEGMIRAVRKIDRIKRGECRRYSLTKFSAKKMAEGYLAIYNKILGS